MLFCATLLVFEAARVDFFSDFILIGYSACYPSVSEDICKGWSNYTAWVNHHANELCQVFANGLLSSLRASLFVSLPENLPVVVVHGLVVAVTVLCNIERESSKDDNEKNYSKGIEIRLLCVVSFLIMVSLEDFSIHVGRGTNWSGSVTISHASSDALSETKVANLKDIILVNKHVLWLQVTMSHSILMAVVNTLEHLVEEVASNWLSEATIVDEQVHEFSTIDQLHYNESAVDGFSFAVGVFGVFFSSDDLRNILMWANRGLAFNFFVEKFPDLAGWHLLFIEDLDGKVMAVLYAAEDLT